MRLCALRGTAARCAPAALALLCALWPQRARAQDRFEIQVYDSEVARAGEVGLELHTNYVVAGARGTSPEGELATRHVLHLTAEPHLGVFGWGEAGAYLQSAVRPEGQVDFAGFKLRFKAKWPEKLFGGVVGLALNVELSRVPASYEANVWGTEVRPIIDARAGALYASVNPIVATDLQGPLAGHPQFEPAVKLAVFVAPQLALGAEYYAALGPVDAFLHASEQNHRLYGVLDLVTDYVDLNLGLGRGLGTAEPWVAKAIFGFHAKGAPPEDVPPPTLKPAAPR
jgi:hypothetical protein